MSHTTCITLNEKKKQIKSRNYFLKQQTRITIYESEALKTRKQQ